MKQLFARIRWRLVGWTMLSVGLILLVLGVSVYTATSRTLMDQVDRSLMNASEDAFPQIAPNRGFRGREGYSGAMFYLAIGGDNRVFANPQQVSLTSDQVPVPLAHQPLLQTITLNGEPTRIFIRPIPNGGRLAVGQSLLVEQNALRSFLVVLLAGGAVGLLLLLVAAWFLAGRALVPIQQAVQRQQEFVADASHELRTPLTILQSSAEMLEQEAHRPLSQNRELWNDIRHEIDRMVRLTMDLLTLARSDQGGLQLMVGPVDLPSLAADVVRRATAVAQEKGVVLSAVAEADAAIQIEADPDRLEQVLLILVDNAIKHTPSGGRVEVRVQRHGATAGVEIVDTGDGISPEHLARIFDRFYRVDAARGSEQGGAGLGLAIAKMLVDAHHGELAIHSTVGAGTTVSVHLPARGPSNSLGHRLAAHLPHVAMRV